MKYLFAARGLVWFSALFSTDAASLFVQKVFKRKIIIVNIIWMWFSNRYPYTVFTVPYRFCDNITDEILNKNVCAICDAYAALGVFALCIHFSMKCFGGVVIVS